MYSTAVVQSRDHARLRSLIQSGSYRAIGAAVGCSPQRICSIYNDPNCRIDLSLGHSIERHFDCQPGELFILSGRNALLAHYYLPERAA